MTEHRAVHPDADRWGGWSWSEPRRGEHFRRCSYCGSIHPADLAAEPVWRAEWADRKYGWPHKFYVDVPNRHPDDVYAIGSSSGGDAPGRGWVPVADLTDEQREILTRDGIGTERTAFVLFSTRPNHHGKFYTVHLSDPAIDADTKAAVENRSGLRFGFTEDGRVQWWPA